MRGRERIGGGSERAGLFEEWIRDLLLGAERMSGGCVCVVVYVCVYVCMCMCFRERDQAKKRSRFKCSSLSLLPNPPAPLHQWTPEIAPISRDRCGATHSHRAYQPTHRSSKRETDASARC